MAVRRNKASKKQLSAKSRKIDSLLRQQRMLKNRRSLLESLETRQLLTAGPVLVGIQPDSDQLLNLNEAATINQNVLQTSPRELTLRFDESSSLDENTLDAIRIVRSGDGKFDVASATTDLGSQGAVRIEFEAVVPGIDGNDLALVFTKSFRTDTTLPLVTVNGRTITFNLNSNPSLVTRASDIQFGINQNPAAAALVKVASISGQTFYDVGRSATDGATLKLKGSDVAQAVSSLGVPNVQVRFAAVQGGISGTNIGIDVRESYRIAGAPPIVSVIGTRIEVLINSNPNSRSTVAQFVNAINNNPTASRLITAEIEAGNASLPIGTDLSLISPINFDVQNGNLDIELIPGYRGLGDSAREVVFRFAEDLPQDQYRIEIDGTGLDALRDTNGEYFNDGRDQTVLFELNLAPTVQAVVPQPIVNGVQYRDQVWVYFDRKDELNLSSARNAALYQLIATRGTEVGSDDLVLTPSTVSYNSVTGVAVLQFSNDLHTLAGGGDAQKFRLRIGNTDVRGTTPVQIPTEVEPGDSFELARDLSPDWVVSTSNISSVVVDGAIAKSEFINGVAITNNEYLIDFPGGPEAPGVQLSPSAYRLPAPDSVDGITTRYYNFYGLFRGDDPTNLIVGDTDRVYYNSITDVQKGIVRQVLDLYSQYLGIQFVETADLGMQIVVGDLAAFGGISGEGGQTIAVNNDIGVIDQRDVDEADDDLFGGEFFELANQLLQRMLVSDFLMPSDAGEDAFYPAPRDIIEGQYAYRPDSTDIDMYRFTVPSSGQITIETVAERLTESPSMLDTHLRLYRETAAGIVEIAANDDYWSEDSEITLELTAGSYYVGVSASGNDSYDPMIEDSGIGGLTEGSYKLEMSFVPSVGTTIVDTTGIALDGDHDGLAGGAYDFWFESASFADTTFVKKGGGSVTPNVNGIASGSAKAAMGAISTAIAAVSSLDTQIIRILPGGDGNLETTADNLAYFIGYSETGSPLSDGATLQVPKDVTVMVDAGAIFKMRRSRVAVGSSSPVSDFSGGAFQVLGTPLVVGVNGSQVLATDVSGEVIFTSLRDSSIGGVQSGNAAAPGDWGGIDYRLDIDGVDESRLNYESGGTFLNVVQFGDFRYGGGSIKVESRNEVISPIELSGSRATINNTIITHSADAAIEASADTFEDTKFSLIPGQSAADVHRIGPDVFDITFADNSVNGMFIRSRTHDGGGLEKLTVQARFDDLDVVHVLSENLVLQGTAGGAIQRTTAPPTRVVGLTAVAGGSLPVGVYRYRVAYVSSTGAESQLSNPTSSVTTSTTLRSIQLRQLPAVPVGSGYVSRRLYRSIDNGPYQFVASLNGSSTDFTDPGIVGGAAIDSDQPDVSSVTLTPIFVDAPILNGLATGDYTYKISYITGSGAEFLASNPTVAATIPGDNGDEQAIRLEGLPVSSLNGVVGRRLYRSLNGEPYRMVAELDNESTEFVDNGLQGGQYFIESIQSRLDARLSIDPGVIIKSSGAYIGADQGTVLLAEGTPQKRIVFTSLNDDRYGRGGTFSTNDAPPNITFQPGDWAGIYVGAGAQASLDNTVLVGGGGGVRTAGRLTFFNAIEVHQGDLRLTNSRVEQNESGYDVDDDNREGLGYHNEGVVFVRGAHPIIASNTFINNKAAAVSFDVNSLDNSFVTDHGSSIGALDRIEGAPLGNQGPLIYDNTLEKNALNGLEIRSGQITVGGVWDDTDIVHVVRGEISIPNYEIYGSLKLQSDTNRSLVVKFDSSETPATIIAGGDIAGSQSEFNGLQNRIGGSLQVLGQPGRPVVLTSINDDTIGAGFDTQGIAQTDTNNTRGNELGDAGPTLPTGPEVNRGTIIDDDVDVAVPGYFAYRPLAGGGNAFNQVTSQGVTTFYQQQNAINDYLNFIDVGADGGAIDLGTTTITTVPTLLSDDLVYSEGFFAGLNGQVDWRVEQSIQDGSPVLVTKLILSSNVPNTPIGDLRFINYADTAIGSRTGDLLFTEGIPGTNDYRVTMLDSVERVGFRQYGTFEPGTGLSGATYEGWIADASPDLITAPVFNAPFSPTGTVDTISLPPTSIAGLPNPVYGPAAATAAHSWLVNPASTSVTITLALELINTEFDSAIGQGSPGDWDGLVLREGTNDRNLDIVTESEGKLQINRNDLPGTAQYLGELAPSIQASSENRVIGFEVYGAIDQPRDVDVYSFDAEAGTEVWFDMDRTNGALDGVIELVRDLPSGDDADGDGVSDSIVTASDGSVVEAIDPDLIFNDEVAGFNERVVGNGQANSLENTMAVFTPEATSAFSTPQDMYSISSHDPGMRVVLPGEAGTVYTYHVRVRSSNLALRDSKHKLISPETGAKIDAGNYDGRTAGPYQLNIRLREADEIPGSFMHLADVRYATNGLTVYGQPYDSPLTGNRVEFVDVNGNEINDTLASAQSLGPFGPQQLPVQPNSNANDILSLAGTIASATDVDWYQITVNDSSAIFDLDYADGLGRADVSIWIFDDAGQLIYSGLDSNVSDDQPGSTLTADFNSLTRGSYGKSDPFIGPVDLPGTPNGTPRVYYVAISGRDVVPVVMDQFSLPSATNPLVRLAPLDSVDRVANDGTDNSLFDFSTAAVPYTLNDVKLYISTSNSIRLANAFTGDRYGTIGLTSESFDDIAIRQNGDLMGFDTTFFNDFSWHYWNIDTGTAALTDLSPATGTGLITQETLYANVPNQPINRTVIRSNTGVRVSAIAFYDNSNIGLISGSRGTGREVVITDNIIWQFNAVDGTINGTGRALGITAPPIGTSGAYTSPLELGYINTSPILGSTPNRLGLTDATITGPGGAKIPELTDGLTFTISDFSANPPVTFTLDLGSAIQFYTDVYSGTFIRDGETITLDNTIYEFDTGVRLAVAGSGDAAGNGIAEGSRITLVDKISRTSKTFEFDTDGKLRSGSIPVPFTANGTDYEAADALAQAINAANFNVRATPSTTGEIVLSGVDTASNIRGPGIETVGRDGLSNLSAIAIPVEEDFSATDIANAVSNIFAAQGVPVAQAGPRVDFTANPDVSLVLNTPQGIPAAIAIVGTPDANTGPQTIPFDVDDTYEDIADHIAAAVQSAQLAGLLSGSLSVGISGKTVVFNGGRVVSATDPLSISNPPGGRITGLANVGSTTYAVSDNGGLYRLVPRGSTPGDFDNIGDYVDTATDLLGLNFSGLTTGPRNVAGGAYANLLFGITSSGDIYAFNTAGELQPIFAAGASSISTGVSGATGFDFSNLDYNLWHVTADPSINNVPTPIVDAGHRGQTAWYFGVDDTLNTGRLNPRGTRSDGSTVSATYDFAGGAHGELISKEFSLEGYSPEDLPTFYFSYFLESDNDRGLSSAEDAFRIYLIDDNGTEHLLTTNNQHDGFNVFPFDNSVDIPDEFDDASNLPGIWGQQYSKLSPVSGLLEDDDIVVETQETFDNTGNWRQARVPLDDFAGGKAMRLRVEFSTAGSIRFGEQAANPQQGFAPQRTDSRLQALPGDEIIDGQRFIVNGRDFEFVLSASLQVPAGSVLSEGDWLSVDGVRYVFTLDPASVSSPDVPVVFSYSDSAADVAKTLRDVIANLVLDRSPSSPFDVDGAENSQANDTLATADFVALPGPNVTITTSGRIGDPSGVVKSIDADMLHVRLTAGQTVTFTVSETAAAPNLNAVLRLFDVDGNELDRSLSRVDGDTILSFQATSAGDYYLGISGVGNENYDPTSTLIGRAFGNSGAYVLNIVATRPYDIRTAGNSGQLVLLNGTGAVSLSPSSPLVQVSGDGSTGVPVFIDRDMTATEVAEAIANVVRSTLGSGTSIHHQGATVFLPGLTIENYGPLSTSVRSGDFLAGNPDVDMARDNRHRGVYLDDFIIGFRERGEQVSFAGSNSQFGPTTSLNRTNPALPPQFITSGEYQLEIRPTQEVPLNDRGFTVTSFDTNRRLSHGVSLQAIDATQLAAAANQLKSTQYNDGDQITYTDPDGNSTTFEIERGITIDFVQDDRGVFILPDDDQAFTISDGTSSTTFEFDDDGFSAPGVVQVSLVDATGNRLDAAALSASLTQAINNSGLDLHALDLHSGVQLVGSNINASVSESLPSLSVSGTLGIAEQLYLVVPEVSSFVDGQTISISRGGVVETYEFDFNNSLNDSERVGITLETTDSANAVARAIASSLLLSGFDLDPVVINGSNNTTSYVALRNDPAVTFSLSGSPLSMLRTAGRATEIPLLGDLTNEQAAQQIVDAITASYPDAQLTVLDGQIVQRLTFTLSDGQSAVTFEFVDSSRGQTASSGNVPIDYNPAVINPVSGLAVAESAPTIASRIYKAINLPDVQAILAISAVMSSGAEADDAQARGDSRIDLSGNVTITQSLPTLTESLVGQLPVQPTFPAEVVIPIISLGQGDPNFADKDAGRTQGIIKIDGVTVSHSSQYGIVLDHGNNVVQAQYPKNLVELNSTTAEAGLVPGILVQNNTLVYNELGGINVQGIADVVDPVTNLVTSPRRSSIAFDRIINNTIVGGTVSLTNVPPGAEYGSTYFSNGSIAFADMIVSYDPSTSSPPVQGLDLSSEALGVPDYDGGATEPVAGTTTGSVSLGGGGSITIQFVDNRLVGSGDSTPDLQIFEVGVAEPVLVEVSIDGVSYVSVGTAVGGTNKIDIDRYGFGPLDPISFVRVTDLNFGSPFDDAAGADIDAIGAIHSIPASVFYPGGAGIRLADGVSPTLLNNVFVNNDTAIDASSNPSLIKRGVLGANTFQVNTNLIDDPNTSLYANIGSQIVDDFSSLFISPYDEIFIPSEGSQLIDSSINSLDDRPELANVRQTVGLLPSPILAPDFDANGALRVDDPAYETPGGEGSNMFKDRGAYDRGDSAAPVGIVLTPLDNARNGSDINPITDSVQVVKANKDYFEILLVDGGEPANPAGGVGIKDTSVTSDALILLKDNVPLVDGLDYNFGYDASANIIRLTPLAGKWEQKSVYQVRLFNNRQSMLRPMDSDSYDDGDQFTIYDSQYSRHVFEIERGIIITIPELTGNFANLTDGETFTVFDGVNEIRFEFDVDFDGTGLTTPTVALGNIPISITPDPNTGLPPSVTTVSAAMTTAIANAFGNSSGGLSVYDLGGEVQILGSNRLIRVTPDFAPLLDVQGSIGVSLGFGIEVPNTDGIVDSIADGDSFRIRRGDGRVRSFEITTDGFLTDNQATPVFISLNATLLDIATAIRDAIALSGLDLDPQLGDVGQVLLPNASDVTLELTGSTLIQLGQPGDEGATPVVLAGNLEITQVAELIINAINGADINGIELTQIGGIVVNGSGGLEGVGAFQVQPISDNAGNTLTSNDPLTGTTQFTIFLASGFDYGDADLPYPSLAADNGPHHQVVPGFSLGATVTPESDARLPNGDIDDGVFMVSTVIKPSGIAYVNVDLTNNDGRSAILDAWIDWDQDGVFASSERLDWNRDGLISSNEHVTLVNGTNQLSFRVPATVKSGDTFGRFRLSSAGGLQPTDTTGFAADGEVEDIIVSVQSSPHQNPSNRYDVNASGNVSPIDALQVINAIDKYGSIVLNSSIPTVPYIDVNGDGVLAPIDSLLILNYLNTIAPKFGEGESAQMVVDSNWVPAANGVLTPQVFAKPEGEQSDREQSDDLAESHVESLDRGLAKPKANSTSIFDNSTSISLDDVIDDLAQVGQHDSDVSNASKPEAAIDDFFANLNTL